METHLNELINRADALDKTATKGPLTVLGPHECARSLHDPKDVHYSVFDPDCGNTAHFFKREDAFAHAESRTLLPLLAKALRETLAEVERLREDAKDLDWLERQSRKEYPGSIWATWGDMNDGPLRSAIRAARLNPTESK